MPKVNLISGQVSAIKNEIDKQRDDGSRLASYVEQKVDFEKLSNLSLGVKKILPTIPELLGAKERKVYLILFENNMELRPTGGFIGSYGLMTFEGGRMTDLSVNDVYSADGQLNGHIDPPEPIRKHLGEANWWLRDSNWDPDFTVSAQRAEWFLDKETDKQVDGVIAVDLSPVKDMLTYTGPIFLSDYNTMITKDNLYEKTQSEVQQNFFAGSTKKASFLTALSRNLVAEVSNANQGMGVFVLKVVLTNLESRHVQMYLHNDQVSQVIDNLGWGGRVDTPTCSGNCISDFTGLVEANLGVNKANYFVSRDQDLVVNIEKDKTTRNLTIKYRNSASPSLGETANYKNYLRVLVPKDATGIIVSEKQGETVTKIFPDIYQSSDYKEVGFLIEVLAGQTKKVEISWLTNTKANFDKPLEYRLYVRKQAGSPDSDKLSVLIRLDSSLTQDNTRVYNTVLSKDFVTRDIWTNTH